MYPCHIRCHKSCNVKYLATHIFLIYISNRPKYWLLNFNQHNCSVISHVSMSQVMYPCHMLCIHVTCHVSMSHVMYPCHMSGHFILHVMATTFWPISKIKLVKCDVTCHITCHVSCHVTCHVSCHVTCHVTSHFMCHVMSQVMSKPLRVTIIDTSCFSADPSVHYRNSRLYR